MIAEQIEPIAIVALKLCQASNTQTGRGVREVIPGGPVAAVRCAARSGGITAHSRWLAATPRKPTLVRIPSFRGFADLRLSQPSKTCLY